MKRMSQILGKVAILYLLLSLISGVVELGVIFLVLREEKSLVWIPLVGIAYQLGALFAKPIRLTVVQYFGGLFAGVVLAALPVRPLGLLWLSILLMSIGLQGLRSAAGEGREISTVVKRASRICGFALSGLVTHTVLAVVGLAALLIGGLVSCRASRRPGPSLQRSGWWPGLLGATMVIHQSHYFCYAYFVAYLLVVQWKLDIQWAGLAFCIGWISYAASPFVFRRMERVPAFSVGHVVTCILLSLIYLFPAYLPIALPAWFLTGFGGGTVFCLRDLQETGQEARTDLDIWENLGHVAGLLVALGIVAASNKAVNVFLGAAAIAALTAIVLPVGVRYARGTGDRNT